MKMTLKEPFTTSFGTAQVKEFFIIEAEDGEGNRGYGESVASDVPLYCEETVWTNWHVMKDFLIPILQKHSLSHPDEVTGLFSPIKRNYMAKSALEGAIWDLYAKREGNPLAAALGGKKKRIDVGISIGIQPNVRVLLSVIEKYLGQGYKRIKIKIKPGWDVEVLREVRRHFPDTPIMADANSAYTLQDIDLLKRLDEFGLMMVEQPLSADDIVDHAKLQREMETPICLDESIHSVEDARKAKELGSCRIINIKIGRVGGLTEAKKIHDYCRENGIALWCGGMLEAGVGRAHNVAITALPGFTLPGDTAASGRYWKEDIIIPEVEVRNGTIEVPENPGIGYEINEKTLERFTEWAEEFPF